MATGISAKLPLAYTKADGPYLLTKDLQENARQNLKNLIFRSRDKSFPIKISLIICNNKFAKGIIYAKKFN